MGSICKINALKICPLVDHKVDVVDFGVYDIVISGRMDIPHSRRALRGLDTLAGSAFFASELEKG